jgi:hypothetical protein
MIGALIYFFVIFLGDRPVKMEFASKGACEDARAAALSAVRVKTFFANPEHLVSPCIGDGK